MLAEIGCPEASASTNCTGIDAFLLNFGSFSLLVSALLLILGPLGERPDPRLHLCDRPGEVGQLTSDKGYVLLDCHRGSRVYDG